MRRLPLLIVPLAALVTVLPGCIAWEVRDEMRLANANLAGANWRLDEAGVRLNLANKNLDDANRRLDTATERINQTQASIDEVHRVLLATNQRLLEVETELTKTGPMMGTTNQRLEDLMILRQVQASLQQIEATLGPLSRSMSSMGGLVSMLGLGGEPEPVPAPTGAEAGDGGQAGAPAAPAMGTAAVRTPNLLIGTWVKTFPIGAHDAGEPRRQALVILSSGKYLLAEYGRTLVSGDWVQSGKSLTLTPTPPPPPAPPQAAPEASPTAAGGTPAATSAAAPPPTPPAPPAPQPITMEVLSNTLRQLSVRIGDEVHIYTRP